MADVAKEQVNTEEEHVPEVSDFQKYMENNPDMANEIMKIVTTLYNTPMKISQVQPFLQQMYNVEKINPELEESLRQENAELYD